ncbi:MAG TPA: TIM barrel protein [Thermodesulfobacteriota bacterium]|nr:TIM barrel protein [Thermodesulfobacteriota bacterium]
MKRAAKKWAGRGLLVLAAICLCGSAFAADKIVLKKYPDLKIGFTTQNFLQPLPVSLENAKKLVDWASAQGYPWIEYRDPSAKLTVDECKQLASYAKSKNLEIGYAAQVGVLDPTYDEIFKRGVENAAVFTSGPKTFRTLAAGDEFKDPNKKGWTAQELQQIVAKVNANAETAKAKGVQYVVENSNAALKGDGSTYFGFGDLIEKFNANMGWQADVANFFAVIRVIPAPAEAEAFLEKYKGKLHYAHVKSSSKEHKSTDVLEENELPFDTVFKFFSANKKPYLAIELNQQKTLEDCQGNLIKSIEFLKKNY